MKDSCRLMSFFLATASAAFDGCFVAVKVDRDLNRGNECPVSGGQCLAVAEETEMDD